MESNGQNVLMKTLKLAGNMIIFLLCFRFIKESSRWLVTKGRIDEAMSILKDIAKQNGKEIDPELFNSYQLSAQEEYAKVQENKQLSFLDLFKTPVLRRNVILMILNWSLTSLLFESNYRNIENLPYSIYITYTIYSFFEFPSDIASIWGLDWMGRRWSAILGLAGFFVTVFINIFAIDYSKVVTAMGMIGRLFIIYAMNVAAQLSLEVVPTQLRGESKSGKKWN